MTRRKKRRISAAEVAREHLRRAKQMLAGSRAESHAQSVIEQRVPDVVAPFKSSGSLPLQWARDFRDLIDMFPRASNADFDHRIYRPFAIASVYADGTITGTTHGSQGEHNICVRNPSLNKDDLIACNCSVSRGEYCCQHNFFFLKYLVKELSDPYSQLSNRLRKGRFDEGSPNAKDFQYDDRLRFRQLLAQLPVGDLIVQEDAELPPVKEVSTSRIAWNLITNSDSIELTPIIQQAKKRGDGWTKGRKVALPSLQEHADSFSQADQQVKNLVRIETNYYRPTHHLDSVAAIQVLVGQPNVLLNGEPAEVYHFNAGFRFQKDAQQCWLELVGSKPQQNVLAFARDCLIHIRTDLKTIRVCKLQPSQIECAKAVFRLPRIPIEMEPELLERVKQLRNLICIEVPEEVAGKIVQDDSRSVILLRAHQNGALDYGIRVRDSLQRLHRPGSGMMLQAGTVDDQPIQYKRSAEAEYSKAAGIMDQLELGTGSYDGSIQDFEHAIKLIGRLQALESSGVEVLWDKTSEKPIRVLGTVSTSNVSVGINRKRDWFQLSGKCDFGEQSLDLVDLLGALHETGDENIRGDFVRVGDKGWTKIEKRLRDQLRDLRDSVTQDRKTLKFDATSAPAIRGLLDNDVQVNATQAWHQCLSRLEKAEKLEPVLPADINATLRDYQADGFRWLRRLAEWGVGGILADDMGLGKTLQTLAVILDRSQEGPTLVIAPTSVGFNWVREAQRFTPQMETHLYRETDRSDFLTQVGPGSLVVCSYGLALRDAKALAGVKWSSMVLDEAQAIKNSRSKTSAAIASIPAQWKVALTGTPVENHLGELWSLFHVISPGVFGGWDQFRKRFAAPIEKENDDDRRNALRTRLQPFVLRRTKSQVLKDLPPRTEMNIEVELTPFEREMYDKVRMSAVGEIDQIAKLGDLKDQRFKILALLTRLRQIACSPRMVDESLTERSSKLKQLHETLMELKEEGHRVLIFSQFVKHLTLIREMLDAESITYEYLDGQTPAAERQSRVDRFQDGDATAFLISLKAGGTGLNLTAADYVIHMDPWWNPAVEDQATDRAHRIGQDKPVMVYRLISQGTIEEEILKLHDTKRDLVSGVMDGTHAAAKLSTSDLIALVRGT